jgi:hypothetical protein
MRRCWTWSRIPTGLSLTLLIGGLAVPALAETYSWRTEDGVYAYTDDPQHIPARYVEQARLVPLRSLQSYERFTPQDPVATNHYANRLSDRLQYLRGINSAAQPAAAVPTAAGAPAQSTISFSTGGANDPRIELPVGQTGDTPIVVDPILAKRKGDFRTRRVTLVKQGDQIIAVLKGSPHVFNPALDIEDEDDLERGEYQP